jgi:hypothetical protein
MRKLRECLLIPLLVLFSALYANASSIDILPSDAAYLGHTGAGTIVGPFRNNVFDIVGTINGRVQNGDPSAANEARSVFEFNVSPLAGVALSSAIFNFTVVNPTSFGVADCFDLSGCPPVAGLVFSISTGDGTVSTNDWAMGTVFGTVLHPTYGIPLTVDVSTALNSLLASHPTFAAINVSALSGQDGGDGLIGAFLTVAQVPEPSSHILLGSGLLLILLLKRHRKNVVLLNK